VDIIRTASVSPRDDVRYSVVMTTVLLFHHAQGQTTGFLAFADELREAGHTVHAPDLYDGKTFGDLNEGVAYAGRTGFPEIIRRGSTAAEELPADIVYAGFSLGVLPAQSLAQTRPGARGAIFFHACVPTSEFESSWPEGVPLQIHMMDSDAWTEEDRPVAEALVKEIEDAELFLYPGSGHLFADSSLDDYDEQAAGLLKERTLAFLRRVG
jgi:dienelactone hydrolase